MVQSSRNSNSSEILWGPPGGGGGGLPVLLFPWNKWPFSPIPPPPQNILIFYVPCSPKLPLFPCCPHFWTFVSLFPRKICPHSPVPQNLWEGLFYACPRYLHVWKRSRKKQQRNCGDIVFPIMSMGAFCCHGNQSFDPIYPQNLMQPFLIPILLHIKFDQDWSTGVRNIQVQKCGWWRTTDGGRTADHWYTLSSQGGSGEIKRDNVFF